ncbi:MAG: right-handed parallel beta-helix repeat-containing protein [Anaerolineae bacterium]
MKRLLTVLLLLSLVAALSFFVTIPVSAAASTIFVRTDGSDTNCDGSTDAPYPGGGPGLACSVATIAKGLDLALPGDTVSVAAGEYHEHVVITEAVTLTGPNAGVPGYDDRVDEAVIDGDETDAPIVIAADGATVEGMTITGGFGGRNAGVVMEATWANMTVAANIIEGNTIGIYANCDGPSVIADNLLVDNNIPGSAGGAAIYSEFTYGLVVTGNEFRGHEINSPVVFAAIGQSHHELTFSNNWLHDNVYGMAVLGVSGGVFAGNTIETRDGLETAIEFAGINRGISLAYNDLGGNAHAIVTSDPYGVGINSDIHARRNDLSSTGIAVDATEAYDGIFDASGNWWGSVCGTCVAASVAGNVDYTPWLDSGVDMDCDLPGFQPDMHVLWADDDSPQYQGPLSDPPTELDTTELTVGRANEALLMLPQDEVDGQPAWLPATVHLLAGQYREMVWIGRPNTSLVGPNEGISPVATPLRPNDEAVIVLTYPDFYVPMPVRGPMALHVIADNVVVDGLTIWGGVTVSGLPHPWSPTAGNDVSVRNNIIIAVTDDIDVVSPGSGAGDLQPGSEPVEKPLFLLYPGAVTVFAASDVEVSSNVIDTSAMQGAIPPRRGLMEAFLANDLTVIGNKISADAGSWLYLLGMESLTGENHVIDNGIYWKVGSQMVGAGVAIFNPRPETLIEIAENDIAATPDEAFWLATNSAGIDISGYVAPLPDDEEPTVLGGQEWVAPRLFIHSNIVTGWMKGVHSDALIDGTGMAGTLYEPQPIQLRYNSISGNHQAGFLQEYDPSVLDVLLNGGYSVPDPVYAPIDATDNWWGCNGGPGDAGCDSVEALDGGVMWAPWLVLTLEAEPDLIDTGGTSEIVAELVYNSAGQDTSEIEDLAVSEKLVATLTATLGQLDELTPPFVKGEAGARFTAGAATGMATITASLDSETVSVHVAIANGVPELTSLQPAQARQGRDDLLLIVYGHKFTHESVVSWDGDELTTLYINSTKLAVAVPEQYFVIVGSFDVTVANPAPGGGTSNALAFVVAPPPEPQANPMPTITALGPETATAGDGNMVLGVIGSNFVENSTVMWNGEARATAYVSPTELVAFIYQSDLGQAGTALVTVANAAPGGGTSAPAQFLIGAASADPGDQAVRIYMPMTLYTSWSQWGAR